jgi:ethanolamine utilization microcompartment shell protein EutS
MTTEYTVTLTDQAAAFGIEIVTPTGTFLISGGLSERPGDTALVVFIDPQDVQAEAEITGDILRVNVAEGMVFGYTDAEMAAQS